MTSGPASILYDNTKLAVVRILGLIVYGAMLQAGMGHLAYEDLPACLSRELREELDVGCRIGPEILSTTHCYEDGSVELHFLACELAGDPLGLEARWPRVESPQRDLVELPVALRVELEGRAGQ